MPGDRSGYQSSEQPVTQQLLVLKLDICITRAAWNNATNAPISGPIIRLFEHEWKVSATPLQLRNIRVLLLLRQQQSSRCEDTLSIWKGYRRRQFFVEPLYHRHVCDFMASERAVVPPSTLYLGQQWELLHHELVLAKVVHVHGLWL